MFRKITRKYLDAHIARYATDEPVLDIGAGLNPYAKYFPNRTTLDIDEDKKPDVVGDIQNLPFEDDSQEFILCTEVLEHVPDPKKAIDEMYRVLKKGGTLVLTTRFVYPLHGTPGDYWRFTRYGLENLFSEWDVIEIAAETKTFSAIGALLQRIVFQSRLRANKPAKALLLALAWIFDHLNWLVREEYGHIEKTSVERDIMTTGYFVAAKKK